MIILFYFDQIGLTLLCEKDSLLMMIGSVGILATS